MKIHKDEVDAYRRSYERCNNSEEYCVQRALEAAYTVRRARKASKRERQRKEKDKQVVESVKPADDRPAGCRFRLQDEGKPYPRSSCNACGKSLVNIGNECWRPTPSKAPEWDGNASAFDAAMKPKA